VPCELLSGAAEVAQRIFASLHASLLHDCAITSAGKATSENARIRDRIDMIKQVNENQTFMQKLHTEDNLILARSTMLKAGDHSLVCGLTSLSPVEPSVLNAPFQT
jgi:hypothetical protein